jgi:hypothetical protein
MRVLTDFMKLLGSRMRVLGLVGLCVTSTLFGLSAKASFDSRSPADWTPWLSVERGRDDSPVLDEPPASADSQLVWTRSALQLVVKYQQNAVRASRILAYLHVAMHEATREAARSGLSTSDRRAAMHLSAASVLAYFYPLEPEGRFEALAARALAVISPEDWAESMRHDSSPREVADRVSEAVRHRARNDGSDRVWAVARRPAPFPGMWELTPPLNAFNPSEALASEWKRWVPETAKASAPPPPRYDSEEFWREVEEVVETSRRLTPEQKAIAEAWHLDHGSVTPAGVWNLEALELIARHGLNELHGIQLLATLNAAMADAFVGCWESKYRWWTMRPITAAARRGHRDFAPHLVTPPFPGYVSGHATVSGAASEVLARFIPAEASRLHDLANEAAVSRLYGGIHVRSDNDEGLRLGRAIGRLVLDARGRDKRPSTILGAGQSRPVAHSAVANGPDE